MPRSGSGIYTLPAGNPVVSGTLITSTWANATMSDIAQALTDSLPRDGSAGMSGNLQFTGVAQRILGDFSNSSQAQRVLFQSNIANGNTSIGAIPNGTSQSSSFAAYGAADPNNASAMVMSVDQIAGTATLQSGKNGTGNNLPMTFITGGVERLRFAAASFIVQSDLTTIGNRLKFQTSSVNSGSSLGVIPNGTSGAASFYASSDSSGAEANGAFLDMGINAAAGKTFINSDKHAAGTPLPLAFQCNSDGPSITIQTNQNVGLWTALSSIPNPSGVVHFFAIGDSDTGIGWIQDGQLNINVNGQEKIRVTANNDGFSVLGTTEGGEVRLCDTGAAVKGFIDYHSGQGMLRLGVSPGGISMQFGATDARCYTGLRFGANGDISHNTEFFTSFGSTGSIYGLHQPGSHTEVVIQTSQGSQAFRFRNTGVGYAPGGWQTGSDIRLKSNIQEIPGALDKLDFVRGCTFYRDDLGKDMAGVIAQDVEMALPEGVSLYDEEGYLAVDSMAVVALLVQSVKELKERVVYLENTNRSFGGGF